MSFARSRSEVESTGLIHKFQWMPLVRKALAGHGGVLDRFDALYFTLPIAYWFLLVVLNFGGGLS